MNEEIKDPEPVLMERHFRMWLMGYVSCFYPEPFRTENANNIKRHADTIIEFMKENNLLNTKPE